MILLLTGSHLTLLLSNQGVARGNDFDSRDHMKLPWTMNKIIRWIGIRFFARSIEGSTMKCISRLWWSLPKEGYGYGYGQSRQSRRGACISCCCGACVMGVNSFEDRFKDDTAYACRTRHWLSRGKLRLFEINLADESNFGVCSGMQHHAAKQKESEEGWKRWPALKHAQLLPQCFITLQTIPGGWRPSREEEARQATSGND